MAALGSRDARDGERGGFRSDGDTFQVGRRAFGRVEQFKIAMRGCGQSILRSKAAIGVFRGQSGHRHDPFDQAGLGGGRQVGGGNGGLTLSDEDTQPEIARFLTFDVFQFAIADADRQGAAFGRNGFGRVSPGLEGCGDQIVQKFG